MSMREKWGDRRIPRFEPESLPEGQQAFGFTPFDLESYLTQYMGDVVFAQRFAGCINLIKRKNADYSQGEEKRDRIAAFRRIARDIEIPIEKAWAIFAQKHWGAVMKYVKDGTVESEPIESRIDDLINYFVLLGAIIEDKKEKKILSHSETQEPHDPF